MSYKPYPRQQIAIDKMVDFINSKTSRKGLFVYPTSYGKALIIAHVAMKFPNKYFINIAPKKELCKQNYETYISYGYKASICSASMGKNEVGQVVFATIGTLKKHIDFYKDKEVVVVADEAHNHSKPGSVLDKFIKGIKKCKLAGTTATPVRLAPSRNGSELRMMNRMRDCIYSSIEDIVQISEVIKDGRWSKLIYEIEDIDDSSLIYNTAGSDYTVKSLKSFSKSNNIVGKCKSAVDRLLKEGRKSVIVYLSSIEEAEELQKILPNSIAVHSETKDKIREKAVKDFKNRNLKILINVGIFIEGFNDPELSSIVMARPTGSITIWYQALGRLVRTHPNKKDGKIIDLSGNFNKFGKIEELTIDNVPFWGHGMFNGKNELLTNFPIKAKKRPTKESLIEAGKKEASKKKKTTGNPLFTWGMFKGRKFWDIAKSKDAARFKSWCSWIYEQHAKGKWTFSGEKGRELKEAMKEYLKIP